jgi:hypothetical protein
MRNLLIAKTKSSPQILTTPAADPPASRRKSTTACPLKPWQRRGGCHIPFLTQINPVQTT